MRTLSNLLLLNLHKPVARSARTLMALVGRYCVSKATVPILSGRARRYITDLAIQLVLTRTAERCPFVRFPHKVHLTYRCQSMPDVVVAGAAAKRAARKLPPPISALHHCISAPHFQRENGPQRQANLPGRAAFHLTRCLRTSGGRARRARRALVRARAAWLLYIYNKAWGLQAMYLTRCLVLAHAARAAELLNCSRFPGIFYYYYFYIYLVTALSARSERL